MPIQSLENKSKLVLHTRWSLTLPPIPEQLFSTNSDTFLTWLKAEGRLRHWPLPSSPASLYVAHISAPHLSDVLWMLSHTAKSSAFMKSLYGFHCRQVTLRQMDREVSSACSPHAWDMSWRTSSPAPLPTAVLTANATSSSSSSFS